MRRRCALDEPPDVYDVCAMRRYAYESPEQARGLKYDGRNDVWALGCLLTELLTLRFVTERGTGAIALDHTIVRTMVEEACAIHPELGGWARRMLEMDPERRPSAQQLVRAWVVAVGALEVRAHLQRRDRLMS